MRPPDARHPARPPEETFPAGSRRLLRGLFAVLALWGIYLAIGATGIFTDVGLFDARRSAIVLACSATFLGIWMIFLARRRRRSVAPADGSARNRASLASLLASLLGYALWGGAWAAWLNDNPLNLTFVLGWTAVALFALSAILAIIGLSDPLRDEGKLLGLVTLALLLLAGLGLILQIRHHTQMRARQARLALHERRVVQRDLPGLSSRGARRVPSAADWEIRKRYERKRIRPGNVDRSVLDSPPAGLRHQRSIWNPRGLCPLVLCAAGTK